MTDDLATWLTRIGLGAHAAKFISQGIDWDVLGDLSECDLKELGLGGPGLPPLPSPSPR